MTRALAPWQRGGGEVAEYGPDEAEPAEPTTALQSVTRAELEAMMARAERHPRSPERFLRDARGMVSVSPEVAAQCRYRLPARKGGGGQAIEGPSVRLAEIVACAWTNLAVIGRVIDDDGKTVTAQGVAIDLERNLRYAVEVRRGVCSRDGRRFSQDMVNVSCNAAIAIATRNATFKAVPRALVRVIEDEADAVARGDVKTLPDRIGRALAWFAGRGVSEADVFRTLGVAGAADLTVDHLLALNGYRTAIGEGHASAEEVFAPPKPGPAPEPPAQGQGRAAELGERIRRQQAGGEG
jgi:hypothetical protein